MANTYLPNPFARELCAMAIGVATFNLTIPDGTTHLMAFVAGGENNKLYFQWTALGGAQPVAAVLVFPGASGNAISMQPFLFPVPPAHIRAAAAPQLRRDTTTAALEYVVVYFK